MLKDLIACLLLYDCMIARPVNVGREANFGYFSIIDPTFIDFEETSIYWSVQFFFLFYWSLLG